MVGFGYCNRFGLQATSLHRSLASLEIPRLRLYVWTVWRWLSTAANLGPATVYYMSFPCPGHVIPWLPSRPWSGHIEKSRRQNCIVRLKVRVPLMIPSWGNYWRTLPYTVRYFVPCCVVQLNIAVDFPTLGSNSQRVPNTGCHHYIDGFIIKIIKKMVLPLLPHYTHL